ncbi:MAG TPA: LCP family protein [Gaiellales bacterium]|nr:LCP family protein [Gaiellales bacterium]
MPDPKPTKPYRTYRGGRAGKRDPDAARFDFSGRAAATATPPRAPTPGGLPAPDMRPRPGALPGRPVATPPAPGGPGFLRRRWRRILAIGIPTLVVLFLGWLYLGYRSFSSEVANANQRIGKKTRAALAPAGNILTSPQISLIMGSDSRGQSAVQGARADSILLVRTDPGKHLISMLSIPRDLNVQIPGRGTDKINAAFAFGGPPLLIKTVDQLTGLKVNHVVLVDFTGFRDLIDALGGITLYNPTKVVSSQKFDGFIWHFGKGTIHLDGRHALAYARIRHTTNPRDSDITRTERQQRVLQALMHELVTPSSLLHLTSIGSAIAKPLATDLSANELLGLGWLKFRAGRTLECHLGGTPLLIGGEDVLQASEQNPAVVQMFLGTQAPQPPPKGELFGPGCSVH